MGCRGRFVHQQLSKCGAAALPPRPRRGRRALGALPQAAARGPEGCRSEIRGGRRGRVWKCKALADRAWLSTSALAVRSAPSPRIKIARPPAPHAPAPRPQGGGGRFGSRRRGAPRSKPWSNAARNVASAIGWLQRALEGWALLGLQKAGTVQEKAHTGRGSSTQGKGRVRNGMEGV
jgi:hypothetical protein